MGPQSRFLAKRAGEGRIWIMKVDSEIGNTPAARKPAGFRFEGKETTMTAITITVPPDVLRRIDELRQLELLSRSAWLRREVVLAVRASR
jgi:Ribbon-helix-helix protein, copG family